MPQPLRNALARANALAGRGNDFVSTITSPAQREAIGLVLDDRERLLKALGKLCRELQCPAMEYLSSEVQNAWAEAFKIVEGSEAS